METNTSLFSVIDYYTPQGSAGRPNSPKFRGSAIESILEHTDHRQPEKLHAGVQSKPLEVRTRISAVGPMLLGNGWHG
jgi:hypothetical protein